ncbi:Phosphopantetheinyl transferase [Lachnospiraceae bacterium]|nr:Phosphopantetheinyl transferase [Lachnospiraceae bacterium]
MIRSKRKTPIIPGIQTIKINDRFYMLKDRFDTYCELIIGSKKALLFDTGCGSDDLKSAVEAVTDLPLLVIVSHGHFDHVGGSSQFEKVYISEYDREMVENYDMDVLREWVQNPALDLNHCANFENLDFDSFSLGDITGKIIPLPGHSTGSVGIFLPELELFLAGDSLSPIMCLIFANHGTAEEQLATVKNVQTLDFRHFATAHSDKLYPKELLSVMADCLTNLGKKRFHKYMYPRPPYAEGYFYVHTATPEPVGLILSENPEAPRVTVYVLDIEFLKGIENELLPLIPSCYREKYQDASIEENKLQELGAGYLLSKYLKLKDDSALTFNEYGRPQLSGDYEGNCTDFSISHSDNYVVLAVSPIPIGADIENAERITLPVLKRVLPPADYEHIEKNSDQTTRAKFWTKVEAVLKAHGTGFMLDPRSDPSFMDGWHTESSVIDDTHVLSCAAHEPFNMKVRKVSSPISLT